MKREVMRLECAHADTCLSDYWGGHHLPHAVIPAYRMTFAELRKQLHSEVSQGAIAGATYDPDNDAWHTAAHAAINRDVRPAKKGARIVFTDLEPDCDGEGPYAYFVFRDGAR